MNKVSVASFNEKDEAEAVKNRLEQAGIRAEVYDESNLQRFWFNAEPFAGKKVRVDEKDFEKAKLTLDSLDVKGTADLPRDEQGRYRRRIVTIHGKSVVGFSVAVHELNDDNSIKLQSFGIGGRRAMGCGIFNPIIRRFVSEDDG